MAQPQQQLPPRDPFLHKAAIAGVIITPLAILLPPRRLDLRFAVLFGTLSLATNHLAWEYTGESIWARFGRRVSSFTDLPEGAKRTQQLLREQQQQQQRRGDQAQQHGAAGLLHDLWMGGETEDWRRKRAEEHRKSMEDGKGLGYLIMEQIGDVLSGNWRPESKPAAAASEKESGRGK
ncbi:hypothetical protein L249_4808 [Ophiocordyceps polyrhachis-furcata BCC 54312]|uniref:Rhomboid family membrane protein n=1 Tax=Ophiocordyceps polyrhachis-furcata BCC 54312 TaxID=1330021 RepID=A0A367L341_9HYPO|nr:hypothetical protein L249_4808 [Ophiocordyceps polyrhachis-furcata BCC 54312]